MFSGGTVDTAFGTSGYLTLDPAGLGGASAASIATQSDGKIVQAGVASDPTTHKNDIVVVRYNTNGSLDANFGTGGVVITPVTTGNDSATVGQVLVDPLGRIVVVGGDGQDFVVTRYTAQGALDGGFGTAGQVVTPVPGNSATGTADRAAIDASGAIIVAGNGFSLDRGFFAPMFRYEPNGQLDPTFGQGTSGLSFVNLTALNYTGTATSMLVDHEGNILVGGASSTQGNDWLVMRFTADGRPDPSWGTGGEVATSIGAKSQETAYGLAEQPDGKIVAVGAASIFAAGGYDIARYNANGTPDTSFGTGGIVNQLFPAGEHANALNVAALANGDLLVGGGAGDSKATAAEFLPNGSLDTSFGAGGTMATTSTNFGSNFGLGVSMAVGPTGELYFSAGGSFYLAAVTGNAAPATPAAQAPAAFPILTPGQADYQFGWAGFVESFPGSGGVDRATDVAVQPDGKVVQIGNATDINGKAAFGLARYTSDGRLDPTFGTAGITDTPITSGSSVDAESVVVQPDGKIVVAGGDGTNLVLVRYNANGTLDSTFGTGGIATIAPPALISSSGSWQSQVVRLDDQGRLIVAGKGFDLTHGFFGFVARFTAAGGLDTSYGSGGLTLLNLATSIAITDVKDMIVETVGSHDQEVLVAGGNNTSSWIVGRLTAAGALDTLGSGSYATASFGNSSETAYGLAEQADGGFVVVGYGSGTSPAKVDVARYTADGSLDGSFGSSGTVSTAIPGVTSSKAFGIAVEPSGAIVAGSAVSGAGGNGITLIQYNPGGSLDSAFDNGGIGTSTLESFYGTPTRLALAPDGKVVVNGGGEMVPGGGIFDFNTARFDDDGTTGIVIAPASDTLAAAATTMQFTVGLLQPVAQQVTVDFSTEDNSAIAGSDYTATSGTLTFAAGSTTATISVPIAASTAVGSDKQFYVYLSNPTGANLTVGQAVGHILNQNGSGNPYPGWTNPVDPLDVNDSGDVTPIDALIVINYLNANGQGPLPDAPLTVHNYLDANSSGTATPIDALDVINFVNARALTNVAAATRSAAGTAAVPSNVVEPAAAQATTVQAGVSQPATTQPTSETLTATSAPNLNGLAMGLTDAAATMAKPLSAAANQAISENLATGPAATAPAAAPLTSLARTSSLSAAQRSAVAAALADWGDGDSVDVEPALSSVR